MENLFLQGQDVDTLLSVKKFDVGLDIWQLTKSKADNIIKHMSNGDNFFFTFIISLSP